MIISHSAYIFASFMRPEEIGLTPMALLWMLPLIAVIAIVYKAVKLEEIKLIPFLREAAVLFGSIAIFMVLTAVAIFVVMKLTVG